MKTFILIVLFLGFAFYADGQKYRITFTASEPGTMIDSVVVYNITRDTSITVKGSDTLHLVMMATTLQKMLNQESEISLFPNPVSNNCQLVYTNTRKGNCLIQITDHSGKIVLRENKYLNKGKYTFELNGLDAGIYYISMIVAGNKSYKKLISLGRCYRTPEINLVSFQENTQLQSRVKSESTSGMMCIYPGDLINYQGYSSGNEYWVVDSVYQSVNINFNFIPATDIDGNKYPVVGIGSQVWMGRNLRVTRYADGKPIPLVKDNVLWSKFDDYSRAYCWYNNDSVNYSRTYGALYTWAAAMRGESGSDAIPSGRQGACPTGWHIPSDAEWTVLTNLFGGLYTSGGKLKEAGYRHWFSPNIDATNRSGFRAVPGGVRFNSGKFQGLGSNAAWWTATDCKSGTAAWWRSMNYYYGGVDRDNSDFALSSGFSVRCIRD